MGPRVPFVSNPFGAISPNKVLETETEHSCFGTMHVTFCHPKNDTVKKNIVFITLLFSPANDCFVRSCKIICSVAFLDRFGWTIQILFSFLERSIVLL